MDVHEAIRIRRSVREYRPDAIPPNVLDRLMEVLRLAPSACNYQPWRFVFVSDEGRRRRLADACHGQTFVGEAPWVVVGCALMHQAYGRMGESRSSADIDVAIALDHLTLAAAAEGLGTCWIGSFHEPSVRSLVGAPDAVRVVALTPLGYPRRGDLLRPLSADERKPREEIIGLERF